MSHLGMGRGRAEKTCAISCCPHLRDPDLVLLHKKELQDDGSLSSILRPALGRRSPYPVSARLLRRTVADRRTGTNPDDHGRTAS